MTRRDLLGSLTALAAAGPCFAQAAEDALVVIEDPELNARYQSIIAGVRCLVCESRSIAESPSGIAGDLKQRIRDMVLDGASDAEIASFLTARYGHSILYRPPLKPSTWALWAGPFVLLAIGGLVFARVVGARAEDADAQDEDAVSRSSRSATR